MRDESAEWKETRTRSHRGSVRMVVSLVVLALLLVSAPALAYDQSGDHVGCVYETTANFNQLRNGTVDFALESGYMLSGTITEGGSAVTGTLVLVDDPTLGGANTS